MFNPVVVYFTGRNRGRLEEDLIAVSPWVVLFFIKHALFFSKALSMSEVVTLCAMEIAILPIISAFWTANTVGLHVRAVGRTMPLEEIMVTRLSMLEIAQGISLRPLAVQAAIQAFYIFGSGILIVPLQGHLDGYAGWSAFIILAVFLPYLFFALTVAREAGGAVGLRAHLCYRDPTSATIRALTDLVVLLTAVGIVLVGGFFLLVCCLGGMPLIGELLFLIGVLVLPVWLATGIRRGAVEIMEWCYEHPEEWWVNERNEALRPYLPGALLTPRSDNLPSPVEK